MIVTITPGSPIHEIKGVGSALTAVFARLGIVSVEDMIQHYPRRYDDYSIISLIKNLQPGPVTLQLTLNSVGQKYVRRGLHITEALMSDVSGSLKITWFNQPYRAAALKKNAEYFVSGDYAFTKDRYQLVNPSAELVSSFPTNTARIIPIYPETKGLKSHQIRKIMMSVHGIIASTSESLPDSVVRSAAVLSRAEALLGVHFPESLEALDAARRRLGFEELFEISVAARLNKQEQHDLISLSIPFNEDLAKKFVASLPFSLTDAQRRVAWRVLQDLTQPHPMNRLVEGDVGSGKTIVAAMACLMAADAGLQVAYMAPTEILARQQFEELTELFKKFNVTTALYIGALKPQDKIATAARIEAGAAQCIIGTHALIQKHPKFQSLALVIIDEQHRFGVNQRERLLGKAVRVPHVLTMTATPIPRSLALTLYGELDISIIDQMPPGRKSVLTSIVSPESRQQLFAKIDAEIEAGRQVYVICPLVDDSDSLGVKSVTEEAKRLSTGPFRHRRVGVIHGQLKSADKEQVMSDFKAGVYDILVSTTVVEVGVNVPNASTIIIEGAERFGLAQLHQLRGRVRRGTHQPYCYLIPSTTMKPSRRLRAMETTDDGFKLAELDLEIRGPGEIYGYRQSGALDLRMAKLTDTKLVQSARAAAKEVVDSKLNLLHYPRLSARINELRKITNLN